MLTMLQLVPVGTAETILSLNAKDRVSQLGGTQAAGSHSTPQLVHESFLRGSAQPNEHGSVIKRPSYLQGEGRIFGAQVSANSSFIPSCG